MLALGLVKLRRLDLARALWMLLGVVRVEELEVKECRLRGVYGVETELRGMRWGVTGDDIVVEKTNWRLSQIGNFNCDTVS